MGTMWQQIGMILFLGLVSPCESSAETRTVNFEHEGQTRSINLRLSFYQYSEDYSGAKPETYVIVFEGTRTDTTPQLEYTINLKSWQLSKGPKSEAGFYKDDDNKIISWPVATQIATLPGGGYLWFHVKRVTCEAVLMRVEINQANLKPNYFYLTVGQLRMHSHQI